MVILARKRQEGQYSIERITELLFTSLDGVNVYYSPYPSVGILNRIRILVWAWKFRNQAVHIAGDIHFVAMVLKRNKFTQTIHDIAILDSKRGMSRWIIKKLWFTLPIAKSKRSVCISKETKQSLIDIGVAKKIQLKVIYNPFLPLNPYGDAKPTIQTKKYDLLSIGTKWNKNLSWVAESLRGTNLNWAVLGRESELKELLRSFPNLNIEPFSSLEISEVLELYTSANCVVMASVREGFGLPILEAQSLGIPVICSDIPVFREIAGEGAVFVPLNDVTALKNVILMIKHGTLNENLLREGENNLKRFNFEVIKNKYNSFFENELTDINERI